MTALRIYFRPTSVPFADWRPNPGDELPALEAAMLRYLDLDTMTIEQIHQRAALEVAHKEPK